MNIVRRRRPADRDIPQWKTVCPIHTGTTIEAGRRVTIPYRTTKVFITPFGTEEQCPRCVQNGCFTLYCDLGREDEARQHYRPTHIQVTESFASYNGVPVTKMFFRKVERHGQS